MRERHFFQRHQPLVGFERKRIIRPRASSIQVNDGGGPVVLTYEGTVADGSPSATPSIASVPLGAVAADRVTYLNVHFCTSGSSSSINVTGATIDGVTATLHDKGMGENTPGGGYYGCILISAATPSANTSGTVTVTYNISCYTYLGCFRKSGGTPYAPLNDHQATNHNAAVGAASFNIAVVAEGGLICAGTGVPNSTDFTAGITASYNTTFAFSASIRVDGGFENVTVTNASRTVSYNTGGTSWAGGISGVSIV